MRKLLVIHSASSLRNTTEEEVLDSLLPEELAASRAFCLLNTTPYATAIDGGFWDVVASYLHEVAAGIRQAANGPTPAQLLYFGVDEVPTLIALSAYVGDEHVIEVRDFDRDAGVFRWPSDASNLQIETQGLPEESITAAGEVILRVELSYPIHNEDVDRVVPPEARLAEITLRPKGQDPKVGLLRSHGDVEVFRMAFREALAAIDNYRPNTQLIHLFLAGPVSACVAAGQELRLRNGRPVQTYRYRSGDEPKLRRALLLTPSEVLAAAAPLTDTEHDIAASARAMWREALQELKAHAARRESESGNAKWPDYLVEPLRNLDGNVRSLPPIWDLVEAKDAISDDGAHDGFQFHSRRVWSFDDRMLLNMLRGANGDPDKIRRLARAFFWHEYLHDYQNLTRHQAVGIGAFPNCLERIDYMADLYGVLHQADYLLADADAAADADVIQILVQCITESIDAFWTFERPNRWWQQRRLRRYLNWYWRREQVRRQKTLTAAMGLLCEPPIIEIAGLMLTTDGLRVLHALDEVPDRHRLEIGIVTYDNRLLRIGNTSTLSIENVLAAFARHERGDIDEFFDALFEDVRRFTDVRHLTPGDPQ